MDRHVREDGGEHAVVMFGSPSGVWLDPSAAHRGGVRIEAGWMLTPLDLRLSTDRPYGVPSTIGTVAAILLAPEAEAPLSFVDSAEAVSGRGLDGDRYAAGRGTFSAPGRGYELTLVESEVLDEVELRWEDARRNIVTRGMSLNSLVGRRFRLGDAEWFGRRLAEPCSHLEKLARPGLLRPLATEAASVQTSSRAVSSVSATTSKRSSSLRLRGVVRVRRGAARR